MKNKFYITTAIDYSSGKPHIGHAYEKITTDVISRYKRLIGYDVFFLTGLDEHGQKIDEIARKNNMDPEKWVDYIATTFLSLWRKLKISNDWFIRTTDEYHEKAIQNIFSQMLKNNDIYLGSWSGLYCVGCEEPYTEEDAIEKDGELYCRTGHKLVKKIEPSYFFKMSKFQNWITQYFHSHPNFVYPNHYLKELENNFLSKGLEDLSVSRTTFDWGIRINENPEHVVYVWIDALFNYVTALGYMQSNSKNYKKYWVDKNTEVVHVIGKDIARFHTIFWPIMLHSLKMRIPDKVLTHGFIMAEDGRKMSKSFGNVVDPNELVDQFGSDIVRYYFLKEFVFEGDNNFSITKLKELYNSELANLYGNIVNRTIGMINLYFNGKIEKVNDDKDQPTMDLLAVQQDLVDTTEELINSFNFKELLTKVSDFARAINKYIEVVKPWVLNTSGKTNELKNFLYYVSEAIRVFTTLLQPVLTEGVKQIAKQMKFKKTHLEYKNINNPNVLHNHKVGKAEPIYNRI